MVAEALARSRSSGDWSHPLAGFSFRHPDTSDTLMKTTHAAVPSPRQVLGLLWAHVCLWLVPALLVSAAVGVFAVIHEETWEASQALIVRNEATGADKGLGKFNFPEEMKNLQETMLEIVKSRSVLSAALEQIGPPAQYENPTAWPTEEDIADVRKTVKLAPPKGGEFGKTEVFYLTVRAETHERSIALNEAVFAKLQNEFKKIRDAKTQSVIDELTKTVHLAKVNLDEATGKLTVTERRVGSDLAELRSMQDMASSDSALRRSAEDIRAQLRETAAAEKVNQELLAVLTKAQENPRELAATPNRLLESHPSLKRLKDGLVDAQLRTSALLGTMAADHPRVHAAQESEAEISRQLHAELALARNGVEVELRIIANRRELLNDQLAKTDRRLNDLASVRAEYTNETAEAKNRAGLLERAEQNLSEAHAVRASVNAAGLISRIDTPDAGTRPVGPGRIVIGLSGIIGGLVIGFGLVFLAVPNVTPASDEPSAAAITSIGPVSVYIPVGREAAKLPAYIAGTNGHLSLHRALHKLAS